MYFGHKYECKKLALNYKGKTMKNSKIAKIAMVFLLCFSATGLIKAEGKNATGNPKVGIFVENDKNEDGNIIIDGKTDLKLTIDFYSNEITDGEEIRINVGDFPLSIEALKKAMNQDYISDIKLEGK